MNVSAINCTPIKPQVSFGNEPEFKDIREYSLEDAKKMTELSRKFSDSFVKEQVGDEEQIKNPAQTAASVLGAAATMFALGATAGQGAYKLSTKISPAAKAKVLETGKKVVDKVATQAQKIDLSKAPKVVTKVIGRTGNLLGAAKTKAQETVSKYGAKKIITVASGLLGAATLAPEIIKADGNNDGIADIAQKNVNAYSSALNSAQIFGEIASVLA